MGVAVAGAFVEDVVARAVRAGDVAGFDAEVDAGVAEGVAAAVAGDGAFVDVDGFSWCGGAVGHAGAFVVAGGCRG